MRRTMLALGVVLALTGAACGGDDGGSDDGGAADGCTADSAAALSGTLTIADFAFDPGCFTVSAGSAISVANQDGVTHTFTVDGTDVDISIDAGTAGDATAPDAGTYSFMCTIHSQMTGTLIAE